MTSPELIKAGLSHLKDLQSISRQTFFDSFASQNTEKNMGLFLEAEFAEEKLKSELLNADSEFYFARSDNGIMGYLKINSGNAQTEFKENSGMEIERIYALKEFYGKGVGKILLDKALEVAKESRMEYIWLGVWEKNPRAIRFYEKNGFIQFGSHPFRVGTDVQTDILMRRELNSSL